MKREVEILEDCLERLQAGASLEQVLALYPESAEKLRPLLEAARLAWSLRVTTPMPEGSMAQSRARFIEKALSLSTKRGIFNWGLRFSRSFIATVSVLVILAIGTSFVSAQSLPGDILYPVKLAGEQTRLLFVTNSVQRLNLEETYDQNRADEVEDLLQDHRQMEVTFVGLLTHPADNQWQVSNVNVVFPPDLNSTFAQMVNSYVEVIGLSQNDNIVAVNQIHLRELDFSGTVTYITANLWFIDQIGVRIKDSTVVHGIFSVGAYVSVKAYRLEDGSLNARQVDVINTSKQEVQTLIGTSQPGENKIVYPDGGSSPTIANDEKESGQVVIGSLTNTATEQLAVLQSPSNTATSTNEVGGANDQQNTDTATAKPSAKPSNTSTSVKNTETETPTRSRTETATLTPTKTTSKTQTETGTQTRTRTQTATQTGTRTQTETQTPTPTPSHSGDGDYH